MDRYTKDDCNYRSGDWPHECGTCVHYQPGRKYSTCRIVHGRIEEEGLCDFWAESKEGLGKRSRKTSEPGSSVHTDPWGGLPFPRGGTEGGRTADFFDWVKKYN